MMEIKVEKFLMKQGNRVGKAAIKFTDGILNGFHLVGFTICDDPTKGGLFVLFPATKTAGFKEGEKDRNYYFLRPDNSTRIADLETLILDEFEGPLFNTPRLARASSSEKTE